MYIRKSFYIYEKVYAYIWRETLNLTPHFPKEHVPFIGLRSKNEPLSAAIFGSEAFPPCPPPRVSPCQCFSIVDPWVSGCGPRSGGSSYLKKHKILSVICGWPLYPLTLQPGTTVLKKYIYFSMLKISPPLLPYLRSLAVLCPFALRSNFTLAGWGSNMQLDSAMTIPSFSLVPYGQGRRRRPRVAGRWGTVWTPPFWPRSCPWRRGWRRYRQTSFFPTLW